MLHRGAEIHGQKNAPPGYVALPVFITFDFWLHKAHAARTCFLVDNLFVYGIALPVCGYFKFIASVVMFATLIKRGGGGQYFDFNSPFSHDLAPCFFEFCIFFAALWCAVDHFANYGISIFCAGW